MEKGSQPASLELPLFLTQGRASRRLYLLPVIVVCWLLYTLTDDTCRACSGFSKAAPSSNGRPASRLQLTYDEHALLSSHCAESSPISAHEFYKRAQTLASILHAQGASAYIAEPGANALYFTNISDANWGLSERPLLLIVSPEIVSTSAHGSGSGSDATVHPRITVLTPSFEATRAKLLPYAASNVTFVEWPEDGNPYEIAMAAVKDSREMSAMGTVYVDEAIRLFIVDGLQTAIGPGAVVTSASSEIRALRERKSPAELALLRCANEATLLALRIVRDKLYIGIRESEARSMMTEALGVAGLMGGFSLTLFGEDAALPHGGGTDRELSSSDFVLVDTGGTLHGYASDLTRTFALPSSRIPTKHLEIWYLVHSAQAAATATVHTGTVTADIDRTARAVLSHAGYGDYFTHRLGHGIGLEVHEAPYLRGGTTDVLAPGNAFSDEPGVYIEGQVGVRLEDCWYVNEDGKAVYFTEGVGGVATSPWKP